MLNQLPSTHSRHVVERRDIFARGRVKRIFPGQVLIVETPEKFVLVHNIIGHAELNDIIV